MKDVAYLPLKAAARLMRVSFARALQLVRTGQVAATLDARSGKWRVQRQAVDQYRATKGIRAA